MTLRRATILVHGVLAATLLAGAAWLAWASLSYTPDPDDFWPVHPGWLLIPMALVIVGAAAGVTLAVRSWMRTGNRATLAVADVGVALTLFAVGVLMPPVVALVAFVTLLVAGALVAAAKPTMPAGAEPTASRPDGPTRMVVVVVIVLAIVIGVAVVAPFLMTMFTVLEPID